MRSDARAPPWRSWGLCEAEVGRVPVRCWAMETQSPGAVGWYPDPDQPQTVRYWDGTEWTEQRAPATVVTPDEDRPFFTARRVRGLIGAFAVVIGILYFNGSLDHVLYPVGLNFHKCGKNAYGSVYCGGELTRYEETVSGPLEQEANTAEREANAAERQIQRYEAQLQVEEEFPFLK